MLKGEVEEFLMLYVGDAERRMSGKKAGYSTSGEETGLFGVTIKPQHRQFLE
jgi:hypothetical protein